MSMKYPRGSEWHKWDLHVHTPKSIVQDYGGDTGDVWNKFIQTIAGLPLEVRVIGITDYLFADGYEYLLTRKSEIPNIDLVIPNIEFRLNTFSGTASNTKRHNFHVLFDPTVSVSDIREQLLNCLSKGYLIADKSTWERTPTINSLQELGRRIKSAAPIGNSVHSKGDLQVGFENITYDREEILKNLEKDCFKGKYLTCIGYSEWDQCRWDQSAAEKRDLINRADFTLTCSDNPVQIVENYQKLKRNSLHKLVLHSSDSHSFDRIGRTFLWIKSDPTFEGLRQILYEPEDRVAIQLESPIQLRSNLTIDKIKIAESEINGDLSIAETEIELNQCLVAVAGGKGAGKTAFVDLIANCYLDRVNSNDPNSFVKRISDQNPTTDVELSFRDRSIFSKSVLDKSFFEEGQVVYVAQGELERYIGDRSDLDKYVNDLIFQSPKIQNSVEKYEFSKIQETIGELQLKIHQKSCLIESLEQAIKPEVIEKSKIKEKRCEAGLKDVTQRIAELEKGLSNEKVKIARKKQEATANSKSRRDLLIKLKEQLKQALIFINQGFLTFTAHISIINQLLKELNIQETFSDLAYDEKDRLQERLDCIELEINKTIGDIVKAQKDIEQFESGIRNHALFLDKKREAEVALNKAKEENKGLEERGKELLTEANARRDLFDQLIKATLELKRKYGQIIQLFSENKAQVLSDLDFVAEVRFNLEQLLINAGDVVDKRKFFVRPDPGTGRWDLDKLATFYHGVSSGDEQNVGSLVDEIERLCAELKGKIRVSSAISIGDLYEFLYGNYLSVIPAVKYKNTSVNKLSLGQKATVLIKIYLAEGDKPIIIDSHDDHLDNEFIMDELICSIREAKKYRQVILVSNNGNVVINSDSEQIILADRDSQGRISYISGSIEAPGIRDRAVKVLEGGSDAFKKRQQKYRIST